MVNQRKAYILALVAVLFWSTIGSAFKITLRYFDVVNIVLIASFVSVLVLLLILLFQNKFFLLRQTTVKDLLRSAGMGALNPFLFYVIVIKAYDILLAQEAVVLNYVWPITLVLLSIPILKQKISTISIVAIMISFAGVVIIAFQGDFTQMRFTNLFGVFLALGSTIVWALFWIFNLKDKRDEVPKLFLNFIFGFIYILIFTLVFYDINISDIYGLTGSVYIGIFEIGITYVIWLKALKLSSTTAKVSNLIFLSPFMSLIIVSIAVGEKIMVYTIIGLVFIIAGIILQRIAK